MHGEESRGESRSTLLRAKKSTLLSQLSKLDNRQLSPDTIPNARFAQLDHWLYTSMKVGDVAWYAEVANNPQPVHLHDYEISAIVDSAVKWKDALWHEAKKDKKIDMTELAKFREKYVRAIVGLIRTKGITEVDSKITTNPCPYCQVRAVGTPSPSSDLDLSCVGWGCNLFVKGFNMKFQYWWPWNVLKSKSAAVRTSAEVFDVNVYADAWVWPLKGYTNADAEISKNPSTMISLTFNAAGQDRWPLCYSKLNNVDSLMVSVPSTGVTLDDTLQRRWALAHLAFYTLDHAAKIAKTDRDAVACSWGYKASIVMTCPSLASIIAPTLSLFSSRRISSDSFRSDWQAGIDNILSLAQLPCSNPPTVGDGQCNEAPSSNRGIGQPFMNWANIAYRNEQNFQYLNALYAAMDPTLTNKNKLNAVGADNYCRQIKHLMSKAACYSQEAYYTKGAVLHVVHELQSGTAMPITRAEYFHSLLENFGDLLKEYTHSVHNDPTALVKTSKYITRLLDAGSRILIPSSTTSSTTISAPMLRYAECIFMPLFVFQKQVRNEPPSATVSRLRLCAMKDLLACTNTYRGSLHPIQPQLTVMSLDILIADLKSYLAELIVHYYGTIGSTVHVAVKSLEQRLFSSFDNKQKPDTLRYYDDKCVIQPLYKTIPEPIKIFGPQSPTIASIKKPT